MRRRRTVRINRQELGETLHGLLCVADPEADTYNYLRGIGILLDLHEEAGLDAIGQQHNYGEGWVPFIAAEFGIDPSRIPHHCACLDCGLNVWRIGEHAYMVRNEVWTAGAADRGGFMCIGCLEAGLGRTLTPADFVRCPLTDSDDYDRSERLLDRRGRVPTGEGA